MEPQKASVPKSFGVVIGGVVVLAILVFGGLYMWGKTLATRQLTTEDHPTFQVTTSVVTEPNLTDSEIDAMNNGQVPTDETNPVE